VKGMIFKEEFSDYLLIANYNFYRENMQEEWLF
jgi:lysozyme